VEIIKVAKAATASGDDISWWQQKQQQQLAVIKAAPMSWKRDFRN